MRRRSTGAPQEETERTSIMLCCEWRGPSNRVLPSVISTLHSERQAPEIHHLWPLMTYSLVALSYSNLVEMFVASEEATPGSVIAYAERISPRSKGSSHCFFCSGEPNFSITSMLPVSGAEQFIARLAMGKAPMISPMGLYSITERPLTSGRKKLDSPRFSASRRSSFRIAGSLEMSRPQ